MGSIRWCRLSTPRTSRCTRSARRRFGLVRADRSHRAVSRHSSPSVMLGAAHHDNTAPFAKWWHFRCGVIENQATLCRELAERGVDEGGPFPRSVGDENGWAVHRCVQGAITQRGNQLDPRPNRGGCRRQSAYGWPRKEALRYRLTIESRGTRVTQWPVTRATAQPRSRIPTASAGIR